MEIPALRAKKATDVKFTSINNEFIEKMPQDGTFILTFIGEHKVKEIYDFMYATGNLGKGEDTFDIPLFKLAFVGDTAKQIKTGDRLRVTRNYSGNMLLVTEVF